MFVSETMRHVTSIFITATDMAKPLSMSARIASTTINWILTQSGPRVLAGDICMQPAPIYQTGV